jgi:hypothetical protein
MKPIIGKLSKYSNSKKRIRFIYSSLLMWDVGSQPCGILVRLGSTKIAEKYIDCKMDIFFLSRFKRCV